MMNLRLIFLFALLLFRFYDLGLRPPHHDEAVNGWFVDGLFQKGFYHYDPQNYHGPLHFYILALFEMIFGRSIEVLRASSVILGGAVSFTPFLFKKYLSERGAWIAAFFLAVSPAMVFYSRYAIHEMGFMLSCILFFYYWLKTRNESFTRKNCIALGVTLALMAGFKENFIMFVICIGLGEFTLWAIQTFFPNRVEIKNRRVKEVREPLLAFQDRKKAMQGLGLILLIASVLLALIFSAAGRDASGIGNFFQAFILWSETGSKGNGHEKPIYYWVNVLFQLEWFAFFGLLLSPLVFKRMASEVKLLCIVFVGLFCAYSLVNYKTPWCVMSFYWGFIFYAAFWCAKWMDQKQYLNPLRVLLAVGFGFSAYQAYDVAYVNVDAENHYYIYGQSYRDLMLPLNEITARLKANPELKNTLKLQVLSQFTWPLPWILGEIKQAGYYGENNAPPFFDADYVVMDQSLEAKYSPRLKGSYDRTEVRSRQWASNLVFFKKQK